jgi:putative addiction module component (TIGR02574 family)
MIDSTQILDAALALNDGERAGLAFKLLQSLKPDGVRDEGDSDFAQEVERRVLAYERGETTASDWKTVEERIRQAVAERERT